jgi:hypothetical protein
MLGSSAAEASVEERVREAEKARQWYEGEGEGAGVERCRRVGATRERARDEDDEDEVMADRDAAVVRRALRAARRQAVQIIF